MSGKEMSVEQIMFEIRQDKAYYDASGGGVTLSGGEVLCHTDFALEIAKACHAEGISVAIETNLSLPYEKIEPFIKEVDLIMADLKIFDEETHKKYTGISNKTIIENIKRISHPKMVIRTPLIEGVTAKEENLRSIAKLLSGKENLLYYQLLNFNPLGDSKYQSLNKTNDFSSLRPYTDEQMKAFGEMLSNTGIKIKVSE